MGIFDFLKKQPTEGRSDKINTYKEYENILDELINEAVEKTEYSFLPAVNTLDSFKSLKKNNSTDIKGLLFYAVERARFLRASSEGMSWNAKHKTERWFAMIKVIGQLLRTDVSLDTEELSSILDSLNECRDDTDWRVNTPYKVILERIEKLINLEGLTPIIKKMLESSRIKGDEYISAEHKKINERINFLLQGTPELAFNKHDKFGELLNQYIITLDEETRKRWIKFFNFCIEAGDKSAASKKWLAQAKKNLEELGEQEVSLKLTGWLIHLRDLIREIHKKGGYRVNYLRDENHKLLKGLIFCSGLINDSQLSNALDDYAAIALKKMPGVGPVSGKTGIACMHAFSMLPFKEGISRLVKFKLKITNNTHLKTINKIISEIAEKHGYTEDGIMEISVPDYGIDPEGKLVVNFGAYKAVYHIRSSSETELLWELNGRFQKAVPTSVKNEMATQLKSLKNSIKEIESALPVHKSRIEQVYLKKRSWRFNEWQAYYLNHPLISIIARKLIWHFENGTTKTQGFYLDGEIVDVNRDPLDLFTDNTEVQLWHPIGFPADDVSAWRKFLQDLQITQPFKQAYREIYILTDAEQNTDTYSNRFAAHILRQHQFTALCKQRGWRYNLMGTWDSHNTPTLHIAAWNITAQFYVDITSEITNELGVATYVSTDQVRFSKGYEALHLYDVPALVFTEVMRDVDLFVGVTSIGNDPAWQDSGDQRMNNYWQTYSFGDLSESSKVRGEVLRNIIPRLKIANVCSFDAKFLHVRGKLRNYKIHLGSGNIMMSPNDLYLCIVPERKEGTLNDKIFLPFEGDNMLSIILSKALLLAEDDKIKDPTIVRQIKQK